MKDGIHPKRKKKCYGNCIWFDGEIGDKNQFCDELEMYVDDGNCCNKYQQSSN